MKTQLSRYHDVINVGDKRPTWTHDSWEIPEGGTDVWCTAWKRGQSIKPYGDEAHVIVGLSVYHRDEFMEILMADEKAGYAWGVEGVAMVREQLIHGRWQKVAVQ